MSTSPLYRSTVNIVDRATAKIVDRGASTIARKHSRVSVIAASAAAAGVLGAAGFAVGAAPWAQAVGNVAKTVQGNTPSASGQPGASLFFGAITGTKTQDGKPLASGPLDTIRSAATAGGGVGAAVGTKHQAVAVPLNLAPKQAVKAQPAKPQPAKRQAAPHPAAKPKVAKPAVRHQAAKPKAHAAPAKPYLMYDSVKPETIPHGKAAAVYVNGSFAAFPSQLGGRPVLWIDTNGSDPAADVLDVEPGDATPAGAAQWVKHRLSSQPHSVAIVYTMKSDWQQVKDNVAALPGWMQSKVRYWIADPTGVPHVVAGSSATQWYWGDSYDITTANPDFVK
jgi:hypothetical protein